MSKFLMDAHMHFDLYPNREDVLNYIEGQKSYTIAVTNLPELYARYYLKYQDYKYIRIALGFHPELAYEYRKQLEVFRNLVSTTRYIGEIGLDYTTNNSENRAAQQYVLQNIVQMCTKDKILSVHSRHAERQCLEILSGFNGKVILHWYTGSITVLREAINRGYYFSINHQMTLSNNGRKIISAIPLDRILLESDGPFSKGMHSEYSVEFQNMTYTFLSQVHNINIIEISNIVKNNFRHILM